MHRVKRLKTTVIPERHVVLDTEAHVTRQGRRQGQRWACGAWCIVYRLEPGRWGREVVWTADTQRRLWNDVVAALPRRGKAVLWAHNLAYDLRISGALGHLPRRGWEPEAISVEQHSTWAAFKQAPRTLLCADLGSFLPASLDRIAQSMGTPRAEFNYEQAGLAELRERCVEDVELEAEALRRVLTFLEVEDCGGLKPTGAGQCWGAFRRRFLTSPLVVHTDEAALEAERVAMWTGRCEAFRHGELRGGPWWEWDLNLAYCRIAAECAVPVRLIHRFGGGAYPPLQAAAGFRARLYRLAVQTETPVLPVADGERIVWPVGEFDTWAWNSEVHAAELAGAKLRVLEGYAYETAPVLAPMAQWLIDQLEGPAEPPVGPLPFMLKYWARALVGRCALRYPAWEPWGVAQRSRLGIRMMYEAEGGDRSELLQVGKRVFAKGDMREGADSVPMVTSWVTSEARRRLWELIQVAGESNVAYVDTDSLIVNGRGSARLAALVAAGGGYNVRRRRRIAHLTIYGPRQLEIDEDRKASGIPRGAQAEGDGTIRGDVWRSLRGSLILGEPDLVVVTRSEYHLGDADARREHLPNGRTKPLRLEADDASHPRTDRKAA
jgi:hypothetical protein